MCLYACLYAQSVLEDCRVLILYPLGRNVPIVGVGVGRQPLTCAVHQPSPNFVAENHHYFTSSCFL